MSKPEFNSREAINATIPSPEPRPFDIAGIPREISREARDALVESLGIDVKHLVSLEFYGDSVEATVYARNAEGSLYIGGDGKAAKHTLSIPVVD
jgi:hypothetical protein